MQGHIIFILCLHNELALGTNTEKQFEGGMSDAVRFLLQTLLWKREDAIYKRSETHT